MILPSEQETDVPAVPARLARPSAMQTSKMRRCLSTLTKLGLKMHRKLFIYIYIYICELFPSPIVSCARLHCVYFCHKITSDGNQLIQNFIYTILFQTALRHEFWRRKSKHGFVRKVPILRCPSSNPEYLP